MIIEQERPGKAKTIKTGRNNMFVCVLGVSVCARLCCVVLDSFERKASIEMFRSSAKSMLNLKCASNARSLKEMIP